MTARCLGIGVIGSIISSRAQDRAERERWNRTQRDALRKEIQAALSTFSRVASRGVTSMTWLTWLAFTNPSQIGTATLKAYDEQIRNVIPELVAAGLDGLECFHTKHSPATSQHYLRMAEQYGLLVTGGSDCHGMSKGKPLIGTVKLPYESVERLQECFLDRKVKSGVMLAHP